MEDCVNPVKQQKKLSDLTKTAVFTALTCVLAPLSLPIGPVPISLTNFVIFLSIYVLGWKMAVNSVLLYLVIGLAGLPVFSGFSGGLGKLMGPTGGYLVGFIPMAILSGLVLRRSHSRWGQLGGLLLGTAVCYALGTAWFCVSTGTELAAALGLCVIPFLPGDFVKMGLAVILGPMLHDRLLKNGLIEG